MAVSIAVNLNPIALDEPDTWPSAVRVLLEEGAEVLRAHAQFERTKYTHKRFNALGVTATAAGDEALDTTGGTEAQAR